MQYSSTESTWYIVKSDDYVDLYEGTIAYLETFSYEAKSNNGFYAQSSETRNYEPFGNEELNIEWTVINENGKVLGMMSVSSSACDIEDSGACTYGPDYCMTDGNCDCPSDTWGSACEYASPMTYFEISGLTDASGFTYGPRFR